MPVALEQFVKQLEDSGVVSAGKIEKSIAPQRLVSVDALRGFDMLWIVGGTSVVQAIDKLRPGPVTGLLSSQLKHVRWEGFHLYDLIFPLFLFIVGVSMVFSLDKLVATGGRAKALARICRRSLLLYVLGVFYSGGLSQAWPNIALGGVLQRIAACYFFAAILYVCVPRPNAIFGISAGLLLGYWALVALVPFPDLKLERALVERVAARIGSHAPAEIAAAVPQRVHGVYEEGRNLTNYVDFRFLPGRKAQVYYINEGLLSTLPAIALPLFGALAGMLLKSPRSSPGRKLLWLVAVGSLGVGVALGWSIELPLIKRIWTSSFVLLTAGMSAIVLAVFYGLVDVLGWRRWCQPLVWIGANAITIYLGAQIIGFQSVAARLAGGDVKNFFDASVAPGFGSVIVALTGLLLVILVARFLYKRNIFIRV